MPKIDGSIYCYECSKQLRLPNWKELEDIHTNSKNEDVCENCCDICNGEYELEDELYNPYYEVE
jgi:hypothetical protein